MALSDINKKKLTDLITLTILPALLEDFEWKDQEELDDAVEHIHGQLVQSTDEVLLDEDFNH